MAYHMKTSILRGMCALQTPLNLVKRRPCTSIEYKDLTENFPEAEWGQTMQSLVEESLGKWATSSCHLTNSIGDNERRKSKFQLLAESSLIEISGLEQ